MDGIFCTCAPPYPLIVLKQMGVWGLRPQRVQGRALAFFLTATAARRRLGQ